MKKTRRILSFIVAMAMIMSMSTLCFLVTAEGGNAEAQAEGSTVEVFQKWSLYDEIAIGEIGSTVTVAGEVFKIAAVGNGLDPVVRDNGNGGSALYKGDTKVFEAADDGLIDMVNSTIVVFTAPADGAYEFDVAVNKADMDEVTDGTVRNWTQWGVASDMWARPGTNLHATGNIGNSNQGFVLSEIKRCEVLTLTEGQVVVLRMEPEGTSANSNTTITKYDVTYFGNGASIFDIELHRYDDPTTAVKESGNFKLDAYNANSGTFVGLEEAARETWSPQFPGWFTAENAGFYVFLAENSDGSELITMAPLSEYNSAIIFTAPAEGDYKFTSSFNKVVGNRTLDVNVVKGETVITSTSMSAAETGEFNLDGSVYLAQGETVAFIAKTDAGSNNVSREIDVNSIKFGYVDHVCKTWNDDATCTTVASCAECGKLTGAAKNPANHSAEPSRYEAHDPDNGMHTVYYENCCQAVVEAPHVYTGDDDTCDNCGATYNAANADYVVSFNPNGTHEVNNEGSVAVELQVFGNATKYASGKIEVLYDADVFDFVEATGTLSDVTVESNEDGKLVIVMYGEDHDLPATPTEAQTIAILTFKAKALTAPESSDIVLGDAGFSTQELAETKDLTPAVKYYSTLAVTVNAREFDVALDEDLAGNGTAIEGDDYTFTPEELTGPYYDYQTPVVMVDDDNDGTPEKDISGLVTKDGDTWTIPGDEVTGELTITVDRTPKTFNVRALDEEDNDVSADWVIGFVNTATYGTDYTITIQPDTWAQVGGGDIYDIVAINIGATNYTGFASTDDTVTIPGTEVKGHINVFLRKTSPSAEGVAVRFEGVTGAAAGDATYAPFGSDYVFHLAGKEEGYNYTITYKIGETGEVKNISPVDGKYTIPQAEITDTIIVNIAREETLEIEVYEYLTLQGGDKLYLVINRVDKLANSHYTMNGDAMFWSDRYEAYCYLVVSNTEVTVDIAEGYTYAVVSDAALEVNYGMDVNMSEKVDANDAQLVYNMYMADYAGFTANVTVEKYLRADVSADVDYKVDSADATAIANYCLNN